MGEENHQIEITITILIISLIFFTGLISYFIHTIIIQYCKRCKKTKQYKLLTQPPYITPRRICHFGIFCYMICQINFICWEFYYLSDLKRKDDHTIERQFDDKDSLTTIHWYEASNLLDTTTFCLMNMLTIIALFVFIYLIIKSLSFQ